MSLLMLMLPPTRTTVRVLLMLSMQLVLLRPSSGCHRSCGVGIAWWSYWCWSYCPARSCCRRRHTVSATCCCCPACADDVGHQHRR